MGSGKIAELIEPHPLVVRSNARAEEVRQAVGLGQTIIVIDNDGYPLGLLTEDMLAGLQTMDRPLGTQIQAMSLPTLTEPDTPLYTIWQGMLSDTAIRWHIVLDQGQIVGVVSPTTLFDALAQQKGFTDPSMPEFLRQFLSLGSGVSLGEVSNLAGELFTKPVDLCFRCPGPPPHRLGKEKAVHTPVGMPICPDHTGVRLTPENPCQGT